LLESLSPQQLIFFVILVVAFALLLTERLRNDIVAVLIVLALGGTRVLTPSEALSGFSSEPAIVVAGIFVLGAAIHLTGLSDLIGGWIGRLAGNSLTRALAVIMPSVALLSAFTHHVTTTAVMLPITLQLARDRDIPASKLLMPLSFAASLGTTITIIGAPAFLIASAVLQQAGRPGLDVFSIAPIGLALALAGTVFMLLFGRFLLPTRPGGSDLASRFELRAYFTELKIQPDSPYVGQTLAEVEADDRYHFNVDAWLRDGRALRRYSREPVQAGDVLLVHTSPDQLVAFREDAGVELHAVEQYQADPPSANGQGGEEVADRFVQAVVAPGAHVIGRTLADLDFRRAYGAIVLALWRKHGWLRQEMSRVRLAAGDVLVLQGDDDALARVANDRAFLMVVPFQPGERRVRRRAPLAAAIMLGTVAAAAFELLPLELATLAGALAVVLTGCVTPRQAYQAIDQRIFVFIAGAIPLGLAMQKTGASDLLARGLEGLVGGWSQLLILMAIFAIVAVLTQFMSDAATTALFAPVAAGLAQALGHPPEPYVVTVAMAAVAAFLTPIGHHGNLLIYGPGRYHFADFVRVGTPLTIVVGLIVVLLAPILWPG
jgi:di/tricarboxylate transporter